MSFRGIFLCDKVASCSKIAIGINNEQYRSVSCTVVSSNHNKCQASTVICQMWAGGKYLAESIPHCMLYMLYRYNHGPKLVLAMALEHETAVGVCDNVSVQVKF